MAQKELATPRSVNHWLALIILASTQFMLIVDVTIVNIALPSIQQAFTLSNVTLQWIVTAYVLTFGGFLLLGGRSADLFGRRRTFLAGLAVFTLASLGCGLATSGLTLIICRAIQGLAGAYMAPTALSLVLVTYSQGSERHIALAVWGAVGAAGGSLGVVLGGLFTQYLGWRWNFWINAPIGLLVFLAALRLIEPHEPTTPGRRLDVPGAILVTGGLMAIVYALAQVPDAGWLHPLPLTAFAIGLAALSLFIWNEARARHPLMPLSLFRLPNVLAANTLMFFNTASSFSALFFATLYVQDILGYSPLLTGVDFLLFGVTAGLSSTLVPRLVKKVGAKPLLITGPLLMAGGLLLESTLPVSGSYWGNMAPGMLLLFFGIGLLTVSITITATSGVPEHQSGLVSGLLSTFQQVGTALGLAVITAVAASSTARDLQQQHLLSTTGREEVAAATVSGFHQGYLIGAGLALLVALLATLLIRTKSAKTDSGHQG
ncbi:MAG TPA: MFS transporter [Ktedonobacteraceae bacterium]|nr:MFS transporter [Ktedonobacteraceae bacterium]